MATEQSTIETFYRSLYRIRRTEEEVSRVYPSDKIKSPVHLSIGQEAVAVGACEALKKSDVAFGTYRSHAYYLAKGGDLPRMIAELYGKDAGCARGKGGSMHLVDAKAGVMGASAVVGTTIPNAAGYAYAVKYNKQDNVVMCFFGDGATDEGVFYETLNFAALKKLPLIFICENNSYAIHTHITKRQHTQTLVDRAKAFGMPAKQIASGDPFEIHAEVSKAVKEIRSNPDAGPYFFECLTYRWKEHVGPNEDYALGYRSKDELQPWLDKDPVTQIAKKIPEKKRAEIEASVEDEIKKAFEFAENSPFPDKAELFTDVYVNENQYPATHKGIPEREKTYVEALQEGSEQAMDKDPGVIVFGLDVDDPKSIQGTTKGLLEKFGPKRTFGTPLSEDAMTGAAIGMALAGMRPVHVHIRMDFMMLAMNQLINVAAKSRYMYGGSVSVPMVVRTIIGKSWGQGAQHSQGLYSFFMNIPGIKVAAPTTPWDAKGCLIAAIRDNNPVVFVEHRMLHFQKGPVPLEYYSTAPGKSRVTMKGTDITIVGISYMQVEARRANVYLKEKGISAEVIDPIWLSPLDVEPIIESVKKTGALLVVDNGWETCGAGAEIIAQALIRLQGVREIKIARMGFAPTTCPPSPALEDAFYPNALTIAQRVHALLTGKTDWTPQKQTFQDPVFRGPF